MTSIVWHQTYKGAALWEQVTICLNRSLPNWRNRIVKLGQTGAVRDRLCGRVWKDSEVFEGLILAVLSNSIDWSLIDALRPQLSALFRNFHLAECARLKEPEVQEIVRWFGQHGATLPYRGENLFRTMQAVPLLHERSRQYGSLESFVSSALYDNRGDVKRLAVVLGNPASPLKVSGIGIPLAAEFLKNIGYDVAKPDRHVNRAAGCFGMVYFARWPDKSARSTPQASTSELVSVMTTLETVAHEVGELVAFADNAIWLLCAKSGLHLSNEKLVDLATM